MQRNNNQAYQLWICDWSKDESETLIFGSLDNARDYATEVVTEDIDATLMDEDDEELAFYSKR